MKSGTVYNLQLQLQGFLWIVRHDLSRAALFFFCDYYCFQFYCQVIFLSFHFLIFHIPIPRILRLLTNCFSSYTPSSIMFFLPGFSSFQFLVFLSSVKIFRYPFLSLSCFLPFTSVCFVIFGFFRVIYISSYFSLPFRISSPLRCNKAIDVF